MGVLDQPEDCETETCVGCGLTVEVDSPVFLEWDADVVGWSMCPDCRAGEAAGPSEDLEPEDLDPEDLEPQDPRRAA